MTDTDNPYVEGRVVEGSKAGHRIRVEDDRESTGGFLIITWNPDDPTGGGDDWVENFDDIARGLHQFGWIVEWEGAIESLRR